MSPRAFRYLENRCVGLLMRRRRLRFHLRGPERKRLWAFSQFTYTWRMFALIPRAARVARRFFA